MRLHTLAAALLLLTGCAAPAPQSEAPRGGSVTEPGTAATEMWSREGLEAQPRMARLQRETPPEMGWSPGTTPWRPAPLELPPRLTREGAGGAATPGALLRELLPLLDGMDALGEEIWEQTTRVWKDEESRQAVGVTLYWGMKDDAEAGFDVRVHMRQGNGRWYVAFVEERSHCARGVTAEGLCV